jgi:hypothetical protein
LTLFGTFMILLCVVNYFAPFWAFSVPSTLATTLIAQRLMHLAHSTRHVTEQALLDTQLSVTHKNRVLLNPLQQTFIQLHLATSQKH